MIIKKLSLKNIRSYENETFSFPEGSTLLSGDIGSGKSSVLLGIEFALFGIVRGELSGESLLRKGCSECSVELTIFLDKEVKILRSLRLGKNGIQQTSGVITIDGISKELTPVELKSEISSLLNYPETTSKSLLYRYTVYTPQEELKRIIQESAESRLNVLRKVFNIDDYKRIKENSQVYISELKTKIIRLKTLLEDLPKKEESLKSLNFEKEVIEKELLDILPKVDALEKEESLIKNQVDELEKKMRLFQDISKNKALLNQKLQNNIHRQSNIKFEKIEIIKNDVDSFLIIAQIKSFREKIQVLEEQKLNKIRKEVQLQSKIKDFEELHKKILELNNCPTCLQKVSEEHKELIIEKNSVIPFKEKLEELACEDVESLLNKRKATLEKLTEELKKSEILDLKKKQAEEKLKNQEVLKKELETLKIEEKKLKEKIDSLKVLENPESKFKIVKENFEKLRTKKNEISNKKTIFLTKQELFSSQIKNIKFDIEELKKKEKELYSTQLRLNWIKDHFINLINVIEKNVLLTIQKEFNDYFKEWTYFLLEDDFFEARIDDSFTPLIQQQGYDISFSDLSGGEKSSIALAYRLALNKVINNLSNVKTKDFLILDEPTDGFSSPQIDKLQEVLRMLDMRQVLLVSHEQKVESFVDNVIKITKNQNFSSIFS